MEKFTDHYNKILNDICIKAVEAFNNSYNLNIETQKIMTNLVDESAIEPPVKEMEKLAVNTICMGVKRNKSNCKNKAIPGHLFCGTHIRSEGKIPLNEFVKLVADKYEYEVRANVVPLGNQWINSTETKDSQNNKAKWPLEIKSNSESLNSYILLFNEFTGRFGAGILVIHYISPDKKKSYYMATHYAEINTYSDSLQGETYTKISFKSITSLKGKSVFNKVKSFLSEYGIPYDINDINKRNSDISENNPVVIYNKINNIINSHYNNFYFNYNAYVNSN